MSYSNGVTIALHFNILLVFSHHQTSIFSLSLSLFTLLLHLFTFSSSPYHSLSTTDQSIHHHCNPALPNHHHHYIITQNNPTSKSIEIQIHPHTDIPKETKRAFLQTSGYGPVLGGQLEQVLVLVEEVCVCGSTRTSLCA